MFGVHTRLLNIYWHKYFGEEGNSCELSYFLNVITIMHQFQNYMDSAESNKIDGEHCLQIIENAAVLVTTLSRLGASLTKQEVKVGKIL